jgi:hypothetical protein
MADAVRACVVVGLALSLLGACTSYHRTHSGPWWADDGRAWPAWDAGVPGGSDAGVAWASGGQDADAGAEACSAQSVDEDLCLVCKRGGLETARECRPASRSCTTVAGGNAICIECRSASGALISKECVPVAEKCTVEAAGGKLCLVCRDAAGVVLSTLCK